jgi:ABC-type sugar transport system, permease component
MSADSYRVARRIKSCALYCVLAAMAVFFLYPLLYSLYNSLLPPQYIGRLVSPAYFTLDNYRTLFSEYPIARWIGNTALNTLLIVVGNVLICCMAGFALSRLEFPGRDVFFVCILASMMVPYQFLITPVYIQLAKMHWLDSMLAITVPFLSSSLYIFMARQYFLTLPKELEDAAVIDGLRWPGIFWKIEMPLARSVIVAICIFSFTGTWNSYLVPATFTTTSTHYTLVVGLKTVKDVMFDRMNLTMAGVVLLSVPILVVFLALQKYFVEGIATTGLKG